jgi:excisionase family DNA binding protein
MSEQAKIEMVRDGVMEIGEAAAFTRTSKSTIYELMQNGILPYTRIRSRRRIPVKALRDLLASELVVAG